MATDHMQDSHEQSQSLSALLALSQQFSALHTEILATRKHLETLTLTLSQHRLKWTHFLETFIGVDSYVSHPKSHEKHIPSSSHDTTPEAKHKQTNKQRAIQQDPGTAHEAEQQKPLLSPGREPQSASYLVPDALEKRSSSPTHALRVLASTASLLNQQLLTLHSTFQTIRTTLPKHLTEHSTLSPHHDSSSSTEHAKHNHQVMIALAEMLLVLPTQTQELLRTVDLSQSMVVVDSLSAFFEKLTTSIQTLSSSVWTQSTGNAESILAQLRLSLEEGLTSQHAFTPVSETIRRAIEDVIHFLEEIQNAATTHSPTDQNIEEARNTLQEWTVSILQFFESMRKISESHHTSLPAKTIHESSLPLPFSEPTSSSTTHASTKSHLTMNFENVLSIGQLSKEGLTETELKEYIVTTVAEVLDEHLRELSLST